MSSNLTPTASLTLSVAASLLYLFADGRLPDPVTIVAKGLSVSALAILALHNRTWLLAMGLLLSSLGDVLLDFGRGFFLYGLAAFLCAHLTYAALFLHRRACMKNAPSRPVLSAVVLAYGVGFGLWLLPHVGAERIPVLAYLAAILLMVITAARAGYATQFVVLGALLFLASDSLLAVQRFVGRIPAGGVLVWTTYYLGQCGIALGVMSAKREGQPA